MSLNSLNARMQFLGGDKLGRNIENKKRSFKAALKNDYNARLIETPLGEAIWCLINNNLLKPDYDRKILSVDKESKLESGDTFRCLDDDSHWMVYLPDLVELAYLKSEIIRCRYTLDINGQKYWIYFQGPTETVIQWYQKSGVEFNEPNFSGTIYIKNTPETRDFFHRFTKIKIADQTWEVQVVDKTTVPGIIELEIQEYYNNTAAELPDVIAKNNEHQIIGQTVVPQDSNIGYMIDESLYNCDWKWTIEGNPRVRIENIDDSGRICNVKIHQGALGTFRVRYGGRTGGYTLDVTIDADWAKIDGPTEVNPYSIVKYSNPTSGYFWIEGSNDNKIAKIINQNGIECEVEILAGKKSSFTLHFKDNETQEIKTLEIQVGSL